MADRVSLGGFIYDSSGIRDVFRGGAMQSALRAIAEPIAEAANAEAARNLAADMGIDELEKPPYRAKVKVLSGTAIGAVDASTALGYINEARHHTVASKNH